MSVRGLAASAEKLAATGIPIKEVNKTIKTLPKLEQKKFRGMLMVAAALALLISGIKLIKNKSVPLNTGEHPAETF